ncbi:MAG TPA: hypothetical protein VGX97_05575 [bacterium]|nr:hypothetical protein [bacterium]
MYEWLATERIATYQREAARDRQLRDSEADQAARPRIEAPSAVITGTAAPSTRRALAAAFVGLAAFGGFRWRR